MHFRSLQQRKKSILAVAAHNCQPRYSWLYILRFYLTASLLHHAVTTVVGIISNSVADLSNKCAKLVSRYVCGVIRTRSGVDWSLLSISRPCRRPSSLAYTHFSSPVFSLLSPQSDRRWQYKRVSTIREGGTRASRTFNIAIVLILSSHNGPQFRVKRCAYLLARAV